jgi:hypothetical protein
MTGLHPCKRGHLAGRDRWRRCLACRRGDAPVRRSALPVRSGEFRTLTFDIENMPLTYWVPDRPSAQITAIAWSFDDPDLIEVVLLGRDDPTWMLQRFVEAYNVADMVTGHYIRKHDLPIVNGALLEFRLPTLGPKLSLDTKLDMVKKADIPATQEHLSNMLNLPVPKVHMTQADWREANRMTPEGIAKTAERVMGDVRQHMLLRPAMIAAGWLKAPRVWRP